MNEANPTTPQTNNTFTVTTKKIQVTIGLLIVTIFIPYYEGIHTVPLPVGIFSKVFEIIGLFTAVKVGEVYECRVAGCIELGTLVSLSITILLYYVAACFLVSAFTKKR